MKNIYDWLDAYGESHQNPTNKKIHWVCVPLIMITLLGLLSFIKFPISISQYIPINLSSVLIILALIFYLRLSISISFGMIFISTVSLLIIHRLEILFPDMLQLLFIYIGVFILSWIGQFIGHKIEGKRLSFFEDIQFLLIGPAWLLSFIYKKMGIKY